MVCLFPLVTRSACELSYLQSNGLTGQHTLRQLPYHCIYRQQHPLLTRITRFITPPYWAVLIHGNHFKRTFAGLEYPSSCQKLYLGC